MKDRGLNYSFGRFLLCKLVLIVEIFLRHPEKVTDNMHEILTMW